MGVNSCVVEAAPAHREGLPCILREPAPAPATRPPPAASEHGEKSRVLRCLLLTATSGFRPISCYTVAAMLSVKVSD